MDSDLSNRTCLNSVAVVVTVVFRVERIAREWSFVEGVVEVRADVRVSSVRRG